MPQPPRSRTSRRPKPATKVMLDREQLIARADAEMAAHPQYRGHYDHWEVAIARRDIRRHGRLIIEKGEPLLVDPTSFYLADDAESPLADPTTSTYDKRYIGKEFATFHHRGRDFVYRTAHVLIKGRMAVA